MNKSLYCLMRTVDHLQLCTPGEEPFLPGPVDLSALCEDLARQTQSLSGDLGADFSWKGDSGGILTSADRFLLTQAILNLLSNAFQSAKARKGGGGKVALRWTRSGGQCRITVSDNGAGLTDPDSPEDPFLAGPGGVGLGLKVIRQCARLHGGTLMLKNTGKGVTAVLSLPLTEPKGELVRDRDRTGGFSPVLVEYAPLLPLERFQSRDVE